VEQQGISANSVHRFIFVGEAKGDQQLAGLYASADITAVPSREDNMPITAMESQSCGTPVVAFNIGGLPDIVMHQSTGYLAQAENPEDLAAGISWILDQDLRGAVRAHAVHTWSPSAVVPQLRAIYQEVLSS
jgi:glycosyltransferase involved in cell wall biosynthesis